MLVRAVLTPPLCPLWVPSWPHRRRFTQCPSESLPVSYGPGAGPLVRTSPVLFLRLPRGGWYGVSMCPAPSHTRTVGSFVGPPRRLLNDRTLSPLHLLPPLGHFLLCRRWGLTRTLLRRVTLDDGPAAPETHLRPRPDDPAGTPRGETEDGIWRVRHSMSRRLS